MNASKLSLPRSFGIFNFMATTSLLPHFRRRIDPPFNRIPEPPPTSRPGDMQAGMCSIALQIVSEYIRGLQLPSQSTRYSTGQLPVLPKELKPKNASQAE